MPHLRARARRSARHALGRTPRRLGLPGMRRHQSRLQGSGMRAVVIGSGLGGVTVAEELAKAGHHVQLVTAETHGYYARPRLSHGFANPASPVMKTFAALA